MGPGDKEKMWLVGEINQYKPVGLPTFGDVLKMYFYHRFVCSEQKAASRVDTAKKIIDHWKNSKRAHVEQRDVVHRIKNLVEKYDALKKSKHRRTPTQVKDEQNFLFLLGQVFDIAPKINYHHNKLQNKVDNKNQHFNFIQDKDMETDNDHQSKVLNLTDEDSDMEVANMNNDDDEDFETTMSVYHQSQFVSNVSNEDVDIIHKIINSPDVSSALDRTNTSNGSFVIILAAIARALDVDLSDCVFSTSTLLRRRIAHREVIETTVKTEFLSSIKSGLVIHWDGKRLKNTTTEDSDQRNMKVERIAVVVTGFEVQKILAIAKTDDGTGVVVSDTVHEHLDAWSILELIVAMCTDTTSANTGIKNGALVLFERKINRNLIYLACRHHVLELIVGAVFVKLFGETTGPNVEMFENFKKDWWKVDKESFEPLSMNHFKKKYLKELRTDVISYIENILTTKEDKQFVPRGDYLEMMELCLLVLGKSIPGYIFKLPQNCSNARWMGKSIYNFKIFLFRKQVNLSDIELANLEEFCLFTCLIYIKSWVQSAVPSNAPLNDLQLLKSLDRYTRINAEIAQCAIDKFQDHLWYLGSELVVLSLFSNNVEDSVKSRIFQKMKSLDDGRWIERNRKRNFDKSIFKKELHDFVGSSSMTVLKSLRLNIDFMFQNEVIKWKQLDDYKKAKQIVDSFKV